LLFKFLIKGSASCCRATKKSVSRGGKAMKNSKSIIRIVFVFALFLLSTCNWTKAFAAAEEETITKGVYIDSVDIGGMTKEQAEQAVKDYVDSLKEKMVTVDIDGEKENITLGDLGFTSKDNKYIEEALEIGRSGNLIKQYKELKDTQENNLTYKLEFSVSDDELKTFTKKQLSSHNVKAKNATVARKNGKFVYTDEVVGMKVNTTATADSIKDAILKNWTGEDVNVSAKIKKDEPKFTREMVEKCNTIIGTYSTTYTSSSNDRAANLANGARLINNTVLYPGDVFSAYEKLTPFTKANGYYEAGAYANGKVIDSIGGGACQVTTTLYNAVLFSELEVVERFPHSMTISYVSLSRDAAIAGTWKDLKFKNDTETPIVIEASTQGRTITFTIWGNETRDEGRKVKFETVVLNEKAPGADVVTKDPSQLEGYEYTTQSAHTGYSAELYKIVYENGVEVSRTRVNKSVYNPSPRYVTVGTKKTEPEENVEEPDDSTDTSSEGATDVPASGTNGNKGQTDGNKGQTDGNKGQSNGNKGQSDDTNDTESNDDGSQGVVEPQDDDI
jgi:vancomycin resistance protein YoaR